MTRVIVATGMASLLMAVMPMPQDAPPSPQTEAPPPQMSGLAARMLAKAGKPAAEREGERVVSGDALVPVRINGRALRLRIEPGLPGMILVAPALKEPLGLKTGGFFGIGVCYRIGREHTCGGTHVV